MRDYTDAGYPAPIMPSPVQRPPVLFPYDAPMPPKHTQIKPRCFTCKHFEMCRYKKDYLKTITLIQNDLGAPCEDFELSDKYIKIPGFIGFIINDAEKYFPKEIEFDNCDYKGNFFAAKFNGINYVNAVYKEKRYFILLEFAYDTNTQLYELNSCREAFYRVPYELNKNSLEQIQLGLIEWREVIINAKMPIPVPPSDIPDIINTTHFSATLDCDMYDWNKTDFNEALRDLIRKYPKGIPIDDSGKAMYHIATYHIEDRFVPYSPYYQEEECKKNWNYFPRPPKPLPKPPKRRDDL